MLLEAIKFIRGGEVNMRKCHKTSEKERVPDGFEAGYSLVQPRLYARWMRGYRAVWVCWKEKNRFVLYTYQTCALLTAVHASTGGVHGPTWGDSKWLFCFCGIQTRTEALFLKRWRNQQRTERLKPWVISECYNSLWLDTITSWTRGQRGDLGVIYCDLSPAAHSPIYANHSGLTLSVAFEIYHDQWGWNELPLDVLLLRKNRNTRVKCCTAAFAGRSQSDSEQTAAESVRLRESWSQTHAVQHRPACKPAPLKTSIDRDRAADSFQIHKQLPLWWVSTGTHAAVRTCGWRVHGRQRSWRAV